MEYISRRADSVIRQILQRGKSVLLLGPRQTGKTTLVMEQICPDISYSLAKVATRQRYEKDPALLERELEEQLRRFPKPPIVFIDEVQKIPAIMDIAQHLIDSHLAQFILTGSSARKLKQAQATNWLPGRVVVVTMTPLLYDEIPDPKPSLEELLLYGTLPGILVVPDKASRERDLYSYVMTYLEEEVRIEALVRRVGYFSRFLEIAAGEFAQPLNFTRLSQDIGVADTTIANYYQILEDCLITHRIDPITQTHTKRRLIRSPKYLFFDLGIRRACANEGIRLSQRTMASLFEHYVGNELINQGQLISPQIKIRYWRDAMGPEIDYIIDIAHRYIPVEVKWTDKPNSSDVKNIHKFMHEYPTADRAYVICRTPQRYSISKNVTALPWQDVKEVFLDAQQQ